MSGTFDPIRDLIKSVADENRDWRPAVVEDISRWSDTGAAFVGVRAAGQLLANTAYRDGRGPLVGETVWISKVDAGHAPYVALPLPGEPDVIVRPTTCVDAVFYVVGRNVETSGYRILRFASLSGIGDTWSDIGACPAAAIGDEEPQLYAAFYSDEYDWADYYGFPDGVSALDPDFFSYRYFCYTRGGELFYSDDLCASWTGTGLTIVHYGGHFNSLVYACSSTALHISRDFGGTWEEVPNSAPPQGEWLFVNPPSQKTSMNDTEGNAQNFRTSEGSPFIRGANPNPDYRYRENVGLLSTAGFYATINLFRHYAYPLVADPPFDATDAGQFGIVYPDSGIRPWHDLGSDDAHWTDTGGFTSNFPLVIDKEYRDWYGPFGAAGDAQHFYAGLTGLDAGSGGAILAADGHVRGFGLPARGSLEARTDSYDGSLKGTPSDLQDWGYLLGSPSHLNYGACFDTNADFGGVAMAAQPASASFLDTALWTCNYNHPHYLSGLGLRDQAAWQGGASPFVRQCNLVGIADETEGENHCSFAIWSDYFDTTYSGTTPHGVTVNANRSRDASVTMRHDLGAYYVTTHHGIAPFNLGWWY